MRWSYSTMFLSHGNVFSCMDNLNFQRGYFSEVTTVFGVNTQVIENSFTPTQAEDLYVWHTLPSNAAQTGNWIGAFYSIEVWTE